MIIPAPVPVCTWSPIFSSDIATTFPLFRFISAVDGKHFRGGGGGGGGGGGTTIYYSML